MRNFNVSRMRGLWALAWWPLALAACSVYDDAIESMPGGAAGAGASSKGGSGASGSDAGRGGSSEQHAGEMAGGASGASPGSAGTSAQSGSESGGSAAGGSVGGSGGGSAGSSGVGGSSGSSGNGVGGNGGGQPPVAVVVDDMEDADQQIAVTDGRNGFWYVGHDLTAGTQTPATSKFSMPELSSPRGDSAYSAYMKASNFSDWGSVIGFNLVEQPALASYDASSYCAVQFWGKAAGATSLRLRLPDADTHPEGGVCSTSGAANTLCYDHFSAAISLTSSWKSYEVTFASLQQVGTGYHPADKKFKADKLYGLEWALPGTAGKTYEIWIDDVTFVECP